MHVAQGRTVDTAHLLVTETLSRQALYVGMTRGRQSNTAYVVTGKTAPPGREPYQQAAPEAVLADVLQREAGDPLLDGAQDSDGGSLRRHWGCRWGVAAEPAGGGFVGGGTWPMTMQ